MDEWQRQFLQDLRDLKSQISTKAEKSLTDQIERSQGEKIRLLAGGTNMQSSNFLLDAYSDSERACMESVESGDLRTAFSTILRYIDTIAADKAERTHVDEKADSEYADQLFQRLGMISKQQIDDTTGSLRAALEERLHFLEDEFASLKNDIETAVTETETSIAQLEYDVSQYGIALQMRTARQTARTSDDSVFSDESEIPNPSMITPRRQALQRSLEQSQRRNIVRYQKPKPKVSDLTSTLTIVSPKQPKPSPSKK